MPIVIASIDLPEDAVGVPFRGLPRFLAAKLAAAGGVIWWWLSAEETFSTILKLVSDPVATVGPEGVCITFISATIPELLLSLSMEEGYKTQFRGCAISSHRLYAFSNLSKLCLWVKYEKRLKMNWLYS